MAIIVSIRRRTAAGDPADDEPKHQRCCQPLPIMVGDQECVVEIPGIHHSIPSIQDPELDPPVGGSALSASVVSNRPTLTIADGRYNIRPDAPGKQ